MNQSQLKYIIGNLSVLDDEELKELDFDSGIKVINESNLSKNDKEELINIFSKLQQYVGVYHHGIKGMKWGIRRYQNKDGSLTPAGEKRYRKETERNSVFGTASSYKVKTRSGEELSIDPVKPWSLGKKILYGGLGIYERDELGRRGDANYTISDSKGNQIGELSLINKKNDTAYIDWITINESNRGKGYASDILTDLFSKARDSGYSTIQLHALKDARPLYLRLGFEYKDTSKMSIIDRFNNIEFGTKLMEYDLNKVKHGSSNTYIYHHGIKGQKWGIRRYQNSDGSLTPAGKKRYSEDDQVRESRKQDLKNVRTLSTSELESKIRRLKLEKEFKNLTEEDISPGRKVAREILSSSGRKVLTTVAAGAMAYTIKVAMTKNFNISEAAAYIASNPNKKK